MLVKIFNIYLETGKIDDSLLDGRLSMLFKEGDVKDPSNYRPINLLNSILKTLEFCIKTRLEKVLFEKISKTQFAYFTKRSGEDINVLFKHMME